MALNLNVELQEAELIYKYLLTGQYAEVAPLIDKIKAQVSAQLAAAHANGESTATVVNNAVAAAEQSPEVADAVDEAEANSDSTANE